VNGALIGEIAIIVGVAVDFVIRVITIIVVPRNRRPTSAMAWLLAIFFIPYVGILFFLLIGSYKLPKARRLKQEQINRFIRESPVGRDRVTRAGPWPGWLDSVVKLNRELGAMALSGGNTATLIGGYARSLGQMAEAIGAAQRFVHVEFYILSVDQATETFFDALEKAVQRGVRVRVLLDHIATVRSATRRATIQRLREIGVEWHFMLPVQPLRGKYQRPDLRNHRKLLVIDGRIAFTGSQNIIDRSYNKYRHRRRGLKWKELMVRFEGPVVAGLNAIFLTDWYSETNTLLQREAVVPPAIGGTYDGDVPEIIDCQVVPSGPGFRGENNLKLFLALLYYAEERIIITSPYFVPDESMLLAITTAVARGVHVELFVSEVGDQALVYHAQRSYYEALLEAGVRIWMYKKPYILHAKHFTIDDDVAVIGTSNMDIRSFQLNMEVSVLVRGHEFVSALREVEDGYRRDSRELTREEWAKRSVWFTMLDNLARLTSALQ
jgi:cardiolipin synthase